MVVCIFIPRFELVVAAGGHEALVAGPLALAPEVGRGTLIGEVSASAETFGVHAGLRLGVALSRCPTLRLVPPDPAGVADTWERMLGALEGVGAAVEAERPGTVWFEERGLRRMHGGSLEHVIAAARRALARAHDMDELDAVVGSLEAGSGPTGAAASRGAGSRTVGSVDTGGAASRGAGSRTVGSVDTGAAASRGAGSRVGLGRIGAAPSRFAALAAAHRARARWPEIAPSSPAPLVAYLAPLPVKLLRTRLEVAALPETLERFGITTLGQVAALSRTQLADRFGPAGLIARDLARGWDTPLRPRVPFERFEEELELPDAVSGPQLERALELLVDRLLARPERRGRTVRAVVLSAVLVSGGTWRSVVAFRDALSDPRRMRLAIAGRLAELPAPADCLRLRVEAFGPPDGDQRSLLAESAAIRRARLREAVRQTRAAAGPDAALRVLALDPDSRVPERRLALAPWEP